MHHTVGKKEIKKEIVNKEKTKGYEKFASRDLKPDSQLELKVNASIHWTTSVNADNSSLKEVYIPSL